VRAQPPPLKNTKQENRCGEGTLPPQSRRKTEPKTIPRGTCCGQYTIIISKSTDKGANFSKKSFDLFRPFRKMKGKPLRRSHPTERTKGIERLFFVQNVPILPFLSPWSRKFSVLRAQLLLLLPKKRAIIHVYSREEYAVGAAGQTAVSVAGLIFMYVLPPACAGGGTGGLSCE
jgi:hypothetical protein